jgi:hypothetical protein
VGKISRLTAPAILFGVVLGVLLPREGLGTAKATVVCDDQTKVSFAHKSDLPPGVLVALGFEMADVGEPFQATDVVMDKRLPWARFISAQQIGCGLLILTYERGGIAYSQDTARLELVEGKWTLRPRP